MPKPLCGGVCDACDFVGQLKQSKKFSAWLCARCYRAKLNRTEEQKEYQKEYRRQYRKDKPWIAKAAEAKYAKANVGYTRAKNKARKRKYREATPACLRKVILGQLREFYKNCPEGMEVDHIVPLNGENVSGLHVPWNLQYLTPAENRRKGNKYEQNQNLHGDSIHWYEK